MSLKVCISWLREWVDIDLSVAALIERMALAGFESELVVDNSVSSVTGVVVGRIQSVRPHPNADRLMLCLVDVGGEEPLQIVCGCKTVRAGLVVAAALQGARLPDLKIKRSKIRGEISNGMLCSARELGMPQEGEGILHLPNSLQTGDSIIDVLGFNEATWAVEITPNRGDVLSLYGLSREIGAVIGHPVAPLEVKPIQWAQQTDWVKIDANCQSACARYVGLVVENLQQTPRPLWSMQLRLHRSGFKLVNPVVDLLNYALLEIGQPMHAFDLDKVVGAITVRWAFDGEAIETLKGDHYELTGSTLVIADELGPIAIAGIIGCSRTAITEQTIRLLIESAWFDPEVIAYASQQYGVRTEASIRYERGVDPSIQRQALEQCIEFLTGPMQAKVLSKFSLSYTSPAIERHVIELKCDRVERVLGVMIAPDRIVAYLTALNIELVAMQQGWQATPPSYRFDIRLDVDLIEEVARLYGYDQIKPALYYTLPFSEHAQANVSPMEGVYNCLKQQGMQQVVNFTFVSERTQALLGEMLSPILLANPLNNSMNVLRTTLWGGLLDCVEDNIRRQHYALRFFEEGACFFEDNGLQEVNKVAGVLYGKLNSENWYAKERDVDYYDIKGCVESLLRLMDADKFDFRPSVHPGLHPKQSSDIFIGEIYCGCYGMINPILSSHLELQGACALFEISDELFTKDAFLHYHSYSKYPRIHRDMSLLVPLGVTYGQIKEVIEDICSKVLKLIYLFDIYRGGSIGSAEKSLGVSLEFQSKTRTLQDSEVNELIGQIVNSLRSRYNIMVRE